VTDFLIYFVILLKSHFCLYSLASVLQDGNEQSSSPAPSESPAEPLKMPICSPLSSDSNLIGLGGGAVGREELDTELSKSARVILMYMQQ